MNRIEDDNTCYITSDNGIIRCDYEKEHKVLFISNLIVNEDARRKGVATTLIHDALDKAITLDCKVVSLEVREDCQWLIEWYMKLGFICVGYGYQESMRLMSRLCY